MTIKWLRHTAAQERWSQKKKGKMNKTRTKPEQEKSRNWTKRKIKKTKEEEEPKQQRCPGRRGDELTMDWTSLAPCHSRPGSRVMPRLLPGPNCGTEYLQLARGRATRRRKRAERTRRLTTRRHNLGLPAGQHGPTATVAGHTTDRHTHYNRKERTVLPMRPRARWVRGRTGVRTPALMLVKCAPRWSDTPTGLHALTNTP